MSKTSPAFEPYFTSIGRNSPIITASAQPSRLSPAKPSTNERLKSVWPLPASEDSARQTQETSASLALECAQTDVDGTPDLHPSEPCPSAETHSHLGPSSPGVDTPAPPQPRPETSPLHPPNHPCGVHRVHFSP